MKKYNVINLYVVEKNKHKFICEYFFEDEYIEEHHFIKAIEWCERIYPASKERIIAKLNDKKEYGEQGAIIIKFKK